MSQEAKLSAEPRAKYGKGAARKLRARGKVPAILYGRDVESMPLSVEAQEAERLFQNITVENTIVGLDIAGESEPVQTLVREIQVHPFRPTLLHIDFYRVQAGVMLEVAIPVHLNGVPDGVRQHGGVLQQVVHEVPVRCLPSRIPVSLEIDVRGLDLGDSILAADLNLDEDIELLVELDQTVCQVVVPRLVLEEEEPEEEGELEEGLEGDEAAEEGDDSGQEGDRE